MSERATVYCAFCGTSQHEVSVMIAATAGRAFICSECVDVCVDMIQMMDTFAEVQRLGT